MKLPEEEKEVEAIMAGEADFAFSLASAWGVGRLELVAGRGHEGSAR